MRMLAISLALLTMLSFTAPEADAASPKIAVVKLEYVVMNSRALRADVVVAWPTAEIAVMGAQGAVNVIHRREIAASDDPDERRSELIEEYEELFNNPYLAAERGLVDEVIEPRETRPALISALDMLRNKRETLPPKKHGNIPL